MGCVPPIRPLIERVLQLLGITSKKTSPPYYQSPDAYAAYGSNRSGAGNKSGDRKRLGRADEDLTWVELTNARESQDSKGQMINGADIMVTTEFSTQFEARNTRIATSPSGASQTSAEGGVYGPSTDIQKVV